MKIVRLVEFCVDNIDLQFNLERTRIVGRFVVTETFSDKNENRKFDYLEVATIV